MPVYDCYADSHLFVSLSYINDNSNNHKKLYITFKNKGTI